MPRMSEADLREWYARFSKEVYEKAQIDVTRKEDLGRIKNFEIKDWDSEDLGNVAFYEILTRNYEAKQKLIEYGNGQRDLSEEELLEVGKDMLFSAMVSKEHSLFHDQESARIVVSPEQAENFARLGAVNEYIQLLRDIPKAEAEGNAAQEHNVRFLFPIICKTADL